MQMQRNWTIRLATFCVWLLAAASVVFWALKFVQGTPAPANTLVVASAPSTVAIDSAALARAMGGGPLAVAVASQAAPVSGALNASRFVLTGIVADKASGRSIALLAVDGKPAKPYRVGAQVVDGLLLQSAAGGQVALASALDVPAAITLDIPKLTTAVAGTAIPARPPVIAPPIAQAPAVVVPGLPGAIPAPIVVPGNPAAADVANPAAGFGQNPARLGASRSRLNRAAGQEPAPKLQPISTGITN
jgi:general secretion pathway protein C